MACICLKSLSGLFSYGMCLFEITTRAVFYGMCLFKITIKAVLHGMCLFKITIKAVCYGVCLKSLSGLFLHGMYLFEITIRAVFYGMCLFKITIRAVLHGMCLLEITTRVIFPCKYHWWRLFSGAAGVLHASCGVALSRITTPEDGRKVLLEGNVKRTSGRHKIRENPRNSPDS